MSKNNEFYSGILIVHKDGLYIVNEKKFKSLENAKTYIDTFLNLSDNPKITNNLKFNDVINSIELKNYFGKKSEKWIPELTKIVEKYKIGDLEVNDKNFRIGDLEVNDKNIKELGKKRYFNLGLFKFSWLGLFFGSFWACYHKSYWWWQIWIASTVLDIIVFLTFDVEGIFPSASVIQGFWGKSLLLLGKAKELNSTGKLDPPSWIRVILLNIFLLSLFILAQYID